MKNFDGRLERLKKCYSQFGARIFELWRGFGEEAGLKNPVTEPKRSQSSKRPLSLFTLPNGYNIFENAPIGFLSSMVSEWEQPSPAAAAPIRTVHLERDAVIRLEKNSGVKRVEIKSGALWLTGTPASGDVLLDKGARFEMASQWPYVLQALEPGEIVLLL